MAIINFEFKARAENAGELEQKLRGLEPKFVGEDHQIDTYFNVKHGRLKLREGNIENSLIHYDRADLADAKESAILLYEHSPNADLKEILTKSLGIMTVVDKRRRIYFIDNVKFHFDSVAGLGSFVEVEAIDRDGSIGVGRLQEQCEHFARFFGIGANDFIAESYSDMIKRT